ncbi:MAG: YebC/PmpR family DNA-binding transcriptional regulator [Sphingomonadaceae bacterium]|uniref:YebC/PmpR family DNA-binding transcriptional regulator n=1 Tax=Thermaurantiacus sp. TaxID=2820283 RepID=UPI00298EE2F7|nr:YebC/PmpR family DNA-binding transcriptional regulator [Thermaurantiacus sp.]MCS6986331.1 YebC/PmpR family DNA-binding transcriptional regulator [Sphingomonadaceae bacterium]MDW8414407.1 YebC/PmpR family DNA-binding transcriptional regulator [Thermaurantiacus sp.]
MAGHSKFKNIMYRKGAQDARRSRIFSKLAREITTAARMGSPDPAFNPRLRAVIATAKANSMPKENIERAIRKAEGHDAEAYEEIRYEGFGPGGVALVVEALTDNRNRAATDVRTAFAKHGGSLGASGSVTHGFDRLGLVTYPAAVAGPETVFEAALEAGAEDVEHSEDAHEIWTAPDLLHDIVRRLEARLGEPSSARLAWRPRMRVVLGLEEARQLVRLLEALEESDDVQAVYGNHEIPDEVAERL